MCHRLKMHLLYVNGETLHDCADMDDTNIHYSDLIKVKHHCVLVEQQK
jgi:hypothetical protein